MKIIALHTDFRIYWPARLKALSKALHKCGDSLDVIEIAGAGSPYAFAGNNDTSGINWHVLFPERKPEDLEGRTIRKKLFKLLDEKKPDVIISGAIAYPSGALAVQYGQRYGTRIIAFDDAKMAAVPRSGLVNFIKKAIYSGVDAMFYPAPDWASTGYFWGFNDNQMFYGVDVVDNDFWSKPTTLKYEWGKYFVAVGRQIPKKNFVNILKAFSIYLNNVGNHDAYNLVLIGEGEEHQNLVDYANENYIKDKVFFIPFLPQAELQAVYQNAEALCCCSDVTETWGLVINEAMACGCPILASKQCGASSTLVEEGVNGYTFDCNDINLLSQRMAAFTAFSDNDKTKMRESSLQIIQEWGLPKFVDGAISAIDSVITSGKRHASFPDNLIISKWFGRYNPI